MNHGLISNLKTALQQSLPGMGAHQQLMPERKAIEDLEFSQLKPKLSAVLVLLYPKNGQWHIVYIKRSTYPGVHSGQISFPGGKMEPSDSSLADTALREAEEEIGVSSKDVQLLGKLSDLYVPPSNFLIKPYVGVIEQGQSFRPEPKEVSMVIELQLDYFFQAEKLVKRKWPVNSKLQREVKGYSYQEHLIWGATGMITHELVEVLKGFR